MISSLFFGNYFVFILPFVAIAAFLLCFCPRLIRRSLGKKRRSPYPVFCSSSAALGAVLLFAQTLYGPSIAHLVEARQQMDADEDDAGDPDTATRAFERQLRQIRRGEPVERLTLRL